MLLLSKTQPGPLATLATFRSFGEGDGDAVARRKVARVASTAGSPPLSPVARAGHKTATSLSALTKGPFEHRPSAHSPTPTNTNTSHDLSRCPSLSPTQRTCPQQSHESVVHSASRCVPTRPANATTPHPSRNAASAPSLSHPSSALPPAGGRSSVPHVALVAARVGEALQVRLGLGRAARQALRQQGQQRLLHGPRHATRVAAHVEVAAL